MVAQVRAGISSSGPWDGDGGEWYDDTVEIGVKNGVPYSDDPDVSRRITSPMAREGNVDNY